MNRPDSQKALSSHPWKCGSRGAWQMGDPALFFNLMLDAGLLHGYGLLHWKPLNEEDRKEDKDEDDEDDEEEKSYPVAEIPDYCLA